MTPSVRRRLVAAAAASSAIAIVCAVGTSTAAAATPAVAASTAAQPSEATVAVVVPITAPTGSAGLIDAATLATETTPVTGLLARELDAVSGQPVTLAIDPRILASIGVLGSSAPASATAWLDALTALRNPSFLLGYADADPLAAGQANGTGTPSVIGFDFAIDPRNFSAAQTNSPEPTSSATPTTSGSPTGAPSPSASASPTSSASQSASPSPSPNNTPPPLPTNPEQLIAWNASLTSIVWPVAGTLGAHDLVGLGSADTVLADSGDVSTAGAAGHVSFGNGAADGIVVDAGLSEAAQEAAAASDETTFESALQSIQNELNGAARPGIQRVLALSRSGDAAIGRLPQLLASMSADGVKLVGLGDVRSAPASRVSLGSHAESAQRLQLLRELLQDDSATTAFAQVATQPELVSAPRRLDTLAELSASWAGERAWSKSVTTYLTAGVKLRSSVQLASSSNYLLIGSNGGIPVRVTNGLDVPITVTIVARPARPSLTVTSRDRRVELQIQPHSTGSARIEAQAVSNGQGLLIVHLLAGNGLQLATGSITVDVQSAWEGVAVAVVVALVALLLAAGVVRTVHRRRGTDAAEPPGPEDG